MMKTLFQMDLEGWVGFREVEVRQARQRAIEPRCGGGNLVWAGGKRCREAKQLLVSIKVGYT